MPQPLGDDFRVHLRLQHQGSMGMSEIVHSHMRQFCFLDYASES
jgi:hypothetical protein